MPIVSKLYIEATCNSAHFLHIILPQTNSSRCRVQTNTDPSNLIYKRMLMCLPVVNRSFQGMLTF